MLNFVQKEFHLERTEKQHQTDGNNPTVVTIRQATPEENNSRQVFILNKVEGYKSFIEDGYKFFEYSPRYFLDTRTHFDYIDDMRNRFTWIRKIIKDDIISQEIYLTIAGCNILQDKYDFPGVKFGYQEIKPLMSFSNGHIDGPLPWLSEDTKVEIHEKVLEMNPLWSGEFDRIISLLQTKYRLEPEQQTGNFKDLALRRSSVYIQAKSYLGSLLDEINRDVFDNDGSIKTNVSSGELGGERWVGEKKLILPLENIVLFYPPNLERSRNSYIGVTENGKFDIRVIAKREKFNYWDTNIDRIIEALRIAIEWWKNESTYSQDELEDMAEAANDEFERGMGYGTTMDDYSDED